MPGQLYLLLNYNTRYKKVCCSNSLTPPHLFRRAIFTLCCAGRYSHKMAVRHQEEITHLVFLFIFIYEGSDRLLESADIYMYHQISEYRRNIGFYPYGCNTKRNTLKKCWCSHLSRTMGRWTVTTCVYTLLGFFPMNHP